MLSGPSLFIPVFSIILVNTESVNVNQQNSLRSASQGNHRPASRIREGSPFIEPYIFSDEEANLRSHLPWEKTSFPTHRRQSQVNDPISAQHPMANQEILLPGVKVDEEPYVDLGEDNIDSLGSRSSRSKTYDLYDRSEEKKMLYLHNVYRANLTPSAANMMYMEWDPKIAKLAQKWAENCVFEHGFPKNDIKGGMGQNLYKGPSPSVDRAAYLWYMEYLDYHFSTGYCNKGKMCGHYTQVSNFVHANTIIYKALEEKLQGVSNQGSLVAIELDHPYQWICHEMCMGRNGMPTEHMQKLRSKLFKMIWSSSVTLGCGRKECWPKQYLIVCHYYPAGNVRGKKPYIVGNPCTQCDSPDGNTCSGNQCVRRNQCKKYSLNCDCSLNCYNCGVPNKAKCSCKCAYGWDSPDCSRPCVDEYALCHKSPGFPNVDSCSLNENRVRNLFCRKMCGMCSGVNPSDTSRSCCKGKQCYPGEILNTTTCDCNALCPSSECYHTLGSSAACLNFYNSIVFKVLGIYVVLYLNHTKIGYILG